MEMRLLCKGVDPDLTLVFIAASPESAATVHASVTNLAEKNFTVWIADCGELKGNALTVEKLEECASRMLRELATAGFKRASLVALEEGCYVAQILLSRNAQIARRAIFVDPTARRRVNRMQRSLEYLQRHWAVPLPFRLKSGTLDLRHLQHRVACPLLIVQSKNGEPLIEEACDSLAARAPSSWLVHAASVRTDSAPFQLSEGFIELVTDFLTVPAKRSQKNIGRSPRTSEQPSLIAQNGNR